jgi:osmotically-inducible protein OsmY
VAGVKAVANDIAVLATPETARADTDIAAAAVHALAWDTLVPDRQIQVTVRDGRVTLEGVVEWGYQKEAAEIVVRDMTGVRDVLNSIRIRPTGSAAEVKGKIEAAFRRSAELDAEQVRVEAHDGRVTLRGRVGSWVERVAAERAAWAAPGVSDVDNHLLVT